MGLGGEDNAVGYWLVKNGFDVWTGNHRGTKYSRTHKNPNITTKEFFSFSFDEFVKYDLPKFYEVVLKAYENDLMLLFSFLKVDYDIIL